MNYKNEIRENPNKIMKQKPASLTVVFFMFLCAVFVSAVSAQEGWKIKETRTDKFTGTKTIVEEHHDGRKRTSITEFFPATHIQKKEKVLLIDGAVTTMTEKTWNKIGEQLSFFERHFDGYGVLREGKGWVETILIETGTIVGRTEQEYDDDSKMWIIKKNSNASNKSKEIPDSTIASNGNQNNKEIFAIEWGGLSYFLHFNEVAKQDYLNFKPISLRCLPNPEKQYPIGKVYGGPTVYQMWSSPCAAAVHAGKITFESGGDITIQYFTYPDPQPKLAASTRNGVTSEEIGGWESSSFRFVN